MKAEKIEQTHHHIPYAHDVREVIKHIQPEEPVYLFHANTLKQQSHQFQQHFAGLVTYAVKANPHPLILHTLSQSGLQAFDVASLHEIQLIHEYAPHATMHFNNPIKTPEAIEQAYHQYGVRSFVLDDVYELEKLINVCETPHETELTVRLALPSKHASYDLSSKFGATPETACELLKQVKQAGFKPSLTFHVGSQCTNPSAYKAYIEAAADIVKKAHVNLYRLNVGGGFPAQYTQTNLAPLTDYFELIKTTTEQAFPKQAPQLVCEPGRAMVASCCHLLTKVLHRRENNVLFLNDGVYGGFMEQLVFELDLPTTTWQHTQKLESSQQTFTLFGPTCDSVDKLAQIALPHTIQVGDYIEFAYMGAYSSATTTGFNGFSSEQYVMVEE